MAWVTVEHALVPPGAGTCFGADFGMVTYDDEFVGEPPPSFDELQASPGIAPHPEPQPHREA